MERKKERKLRKKSLTKYREFNFRFCFDNATVNVNK